ncbi:2-oxo-4-hydroxy-4-carboxy-5-ureidoimidazoline decarboxylase [Paenibacillus aurantiacus]|uniref:2-oxo-4-hydroxy-4-carboxy-5-ureidoimidazoline decarboxylase n=1 Tax=Paenibacillus aurantiacus TaxID=1936118 RepID=A0ABV5L1L1_9BACL
MKLTIEQVNGLSAETFIETFAAIFEHSPWVTEQAEQGRPYRSGADLHEAMLRIVRQAPSDAELHFIRKHPDLATRMAMGEYSVKEQQGVGLDRLSPEEYERFTTMNRRYMEKFGFPFIFAVRGRTKADIEASMAARIDNTAEQEREEAMRQIGRITRLRLEDLIAFGETE